MPGSPSKKKRTKRKAPDSDLKALDEQTGSGKRSRAHTKSSLSPSNDADESQHRRSGRSGAGKGGRVAQLEKIGAILDAPMRTSQPKGTTSLNADFPVNPLAPEPPRKGRGSRSKVFPPADSRYDANQMHRSSNLLLQLPQLLLLLTPLQRHWFQTAWLLGHGQRKLK